MANNLVETLMGAVVLTITAMFLYFAFSQTGYSTKGGYSLIARFDKVDGLANGSDVRISGIKVGTVLNQYLDKDTFQAVVEISLDSDIKVPDDTFAKITSEGLLGGNYLVLDPGGSDELLGDGDQITETQGAVDLLNLLDKFAGSKD